ncbi:MAG: hypothetical protein FJ189_00520 [Gammaproteobacteria bacterium]|nr:hypothetical protein [Gammaproteobacteria bacterium]
MADKAYGVRTDLNQPQAKVKRMVKTGQTYGKAGEQMASQRLQPMGPPPTETQASRLAADKRRPLPPLARASERKKEPITAGAPFGPGVGPIAAGIPTFDPAAAAIEELKLLAQLDQNSDLADLASRWMS